MSRRTWLVLDMGYLCWRAAHAFGSLSHRGTATGATFGVLRDLITLQDQFASRNLVFCWDYGKKLKRQEVLETYKSRRAKDKLDPEKLIAFAKLRKEMKRLRDDYLSYLGFENIFYQKGYEADDVIASVCGNISPKDDIVVVSGDQDLYQLINERTVVWSPAKKKVYGIKTFQDEFGIHPQNWVHVKAISGCKSDEVPGVKGVGEITACKYLAGKLKKDDVKAKLIKDWMKSYDYTRNMDLVRLPYTGTKDFIPSLDAMSPDQWNKLMTKLGMKSLVNRAPASLDETFKLRQVKIKRASDG